GFSGGGSASLEKRSIVSNSFDELAA
ncbi:unnamed protein product, partial [Oikopleura dioica]